VGAELARSCSGRRQGLCALRFRGEPLPAARIRNIQIAFQGRACGLNVLAALLPAQGTRHANHQTV